MSKKKKRSNRLDEADDRTEESGADDARDASDAASDGQDESAAGYAPETQRQRWVKYGSNVALVSVVAIVLTVLVVVVADRPQLRARIDTTSTGANSLKPQTVNLIRGLDKPVKIVSLYSKTKDAPRDADGRVRPQEDYAGAVRDLLDNYRRNSPNIEIDFIDPEESPAKVDALIGEVTEKYGGEVRKYRDFLDRWPAQFKEIKALAAKEAGEASQIAAQQEFGQSRAAENVRLATQSILDTANDLEALQSRIDQRLKQRPPDYKGATEAIRVNMEDFSGLLGQVISIFESAPGVKAATQPGTQPATQPAAAEDEGPPIPAPIREYIVRSLPQYREMKRLADAAVDQIKGLGELKLDELRQKLRERDAILVLGPEDMRSLSFQQVWQVDPDVQRFLRAGGAPDDIKPRFAGEQQVTTAILGLTASKKQKVAFVRSGGPPWTTAGNPFQRPGDFARVAQRLREYNFEILEKDLSGTWAAQSRGMMPPEPEPSDEEIKDAVWVVIAVPSGNPMNPMAPVGGDLAPRLAAHLDAGGSAMVLASPRAPDLSAALDKWGVGVRGEAVAVHDKVTAPAGAAGDIVDEVQRVPFIFVLNQYGNHLITKPMRSLDTILIASTVVETKGAAGATVTPLLSTPAEPKSWGETDLQKMAEGDAEFNPSATAAGRGDVPGPVVVGAASERQGAGRLVVFGGINWATNEAMILPDPTLAQKGYIVTRFPGNAELFTNSAFWLAKMDTMIAISPAAMEVNRIEDMSPGASAFWRVGVLLIGLPLAVVVAGTLVYLGRRD